MSDEEPVQPQDWMTKLSAMIVELEEARARAAKEAIQATTQLLINFAALSPFANPELLPPFQRFITRKDPRADPRYPISQQAIPPQQPVYLKAVPRTPPRAMPAYTPPPRTAPPRPVPPRNPNGTWRRGDLPWS